MFSWFKLEALEYFSSSLSMLGTADQGSELGDDHDVLSITLKPLPTKSSNWLSADVSAHLEFPIKLNLALQYITKLIREHPSWPETFAESNVEASYSDEYMIQYEKSVESFKERLYTGIALFEQRFLLSPYCLISMVCYPSTLNDCFYSSFLFPFFCVCDHCEQYTSSDYSYSYFPFLQSSLLLCHHGLLYIGYDIADGCAAGGLSEKKNNIVHAFNLYHSWVKPLFKTVEEISFFYSRIFSACSMEYSQQSSAFLEKGATTECRSTFLDASHCQFEGHLISLWYLRAILRIQLGSISKDLITKQLYYILDLFEYYLHFSLAWLQKNSEALLFMVEPFLVAQGNGRNPYEVDMVDLKKLIPKIAELLPQNSFVSNIKSLEVSNCAEDKQVADVKHSIPDDERWKILGSCLWQHMSRFMIYNLNLVLDKLEDGNMSGSFHQKYAYRESILMNMDFDSISLPEQIRLVSFSLCDLLMTTVTHISSYHVEQLAELLRQKFENNLNVITFEWLKQPSQSESNLSQDLDVLEQLNGKDKYLVHQLLWDHCADPKLLSDCFAQEKLNWSSDLDHMPTKGWNDMYIIMTGLHKTDDTHDNECKLSSRSSSHEIGSPVKGMFPSGHAYARSNQKDTIQMDISVFQNPKEMYKRNGELLEVIFPST